MKAKRAEPFTRFAHLASHIVAGEANELPSQRRDTDEQFVRHLGTAGAQMPDSEVEINRVPEGDGRGEKDQPGGTMALVLECAVVQFAEAV